MRRFPFAATVLVMMHLGIARADEQTDAKAVLDAAIEAKGGEAKLSKIVGGWIKSKRTYYNGDFKTTGYVESFSQRGEKERTVLLDSDYKVNEIIVFNGKKAFVKIGEQAAKELSGERSVVFRESAYRNWVTLLLPLKAKEFRLSLIDDTSVRGRPAVGILVSHDKHDPLKLYFDKETHLLVKQQYKSKNPANGKDADTECIYSDFQNVKGTRAPFKAEIFVGGQKIGDGTVIERELYEKPLDDKLFSEP